MGREGRKQRSPPPRLPRRRGGGRWVLPGPVGGALSLRSGPAGGRQRPASIAAAGLGRDAGTGLPPSHTPPFFLPFFLLPPFFPPFFFFLFIFFPFPFFPFLLLGGGGVGVVFWGASSASPLELLFGPWLPSPPASPFPPRSLRRLCVAWRVPVFLSPPRSPPSAPLSPRNGAEQLHPSSFFSCCHMSPRRGTISLVVF